VQYYLFDKSRFFPFQHSVQSDAAAEVHFKQIAEQALQISFAFCEIFL
jgi:hypothetical protein